MYTCIYIVCDQPDVATLYKLGKFKAYCVKFWKKITSVHSPLLLKRVFEILTRGAGQKNETEVK